MANFLQQIHIQGMFQNIRGAFPKHMDNALLLNLAIWIHKH
jgi:hypothetical protein